MNRNKKIITEAFDQWVQGTGNFFDLLSEDIEWTIVGNSPISGTYVGKKDYLTGAILPFNARLSTKLVPTVRGIYADGDMVIALWEGTATAKDGQPYHNTYSWYMTMQNDRIVRVTAFLDSIELARLWERIPPDA